MTRLTGLWHEVRTRIELRFLVGLLLVGMGLWGFLALADEFIKGDTSDIDEAILLSLGNPADLNDPPGPPWLKEMGRDFTALGGVAVVGLVNGMTCLYLAFARRWTMLWPVLLVVVGSQVANSLLKVGFHRPRPDLVPHGQIVYYASFPSGAL